MTGSHEVSGSIPLISTKTKSHSERNGFLLYPDMSGARSLRFDHKHFAIARWPRRKAPQLLAAPKGNAQGHGANKVGGVPVGFCGTKAPFFLHEMQKT